MQQTENQDHRIQEDQFVDFPSLAALRLEIGDLEGLASQGVVCAERRGNRTYYKLRFRRAGRQIVRYIGGANRAAIVQEELAMLQTETKVMRELNAKVKFANKMIREAKQAIEPVLKANGFVFHGLAIRRPRRRKNGATTNSNS